MFGALTPTSSGEEFDQPLLVGLADFRSLVIPSGGDGGLRETSVGEEGLSVGVGDRSRSESLRSGVGSWDWFGLTSRGGLLGVIERSGGGAGTGVKGSGSSVSLGRLGRPGLSSLGILDSRQSLLSGEEPSLGLRSGFELFGSLVPRVRSRGGGSARSGESGSKREVGVVDRDAVLVGEGLLGLFGFEDRGRGRGWGRSDRGAYNLTLDGGDTGGGDRTGSDGDSEGRDGDSGRLDEGGSLLGPGHRFVQFDDGGAGRSNDDPFLDVVELLLDGRATDLVSPGLDGRFGHIDDLLDDSGLGLVAGDRHVGDSRDMLHGRHGGIGGGSNRGRGQRSGS